MAKLVLMPSVKKAMQAKKPTREMSALDKQIADAKDPEVKKDLVKIRKLMVRAEAEQKRFDAESAALNQQLFEDTGIDVRGLS